MGVMGAMGVRTQRTIRRPASVSGVGYWSGRATRVDLLPAPAYAGVIFLRGSGAGAARITATVERRVDAQQRTALAVGGARVEMVEHVLSALAGLEVDSCLVRVPETELPGLDGSAQAFVEAIDAAGFEDLGAPVEPLVLDTTLRVEDGAAWIEAGPPRHPGLSVDYTLDYGPGPIGRQTLELMITPDVYRAELAAARTFITVADAERLRAAGLAPTAGTGDLLVFGPDGPIDNPLRWPDECVRHKVLDLVGDLALAGRPLHAHVRACRSGHRLNAALVTRILAALGRRASA